MLGMLVAYGAVLLLAAGRLNWLEGWVYLVMNAVTQGVSAVVLISRNPGLLAERSRLHPGSGTKSWDRYLSLAVALLAPLAILVTAGLDARFGWTAPTNRTAWAAAVALALACQIFVVWAMASNPFFAVTVRIQDDRGHRVVSSGPYRLVRHPGYLGALLYSLLCPLVLGSWWTFLPVIFSCILIAIRASLEDRTLKAELPGYAEYAAAVRWRLFPGVW
jgi:protein-S-isoprenylcysteine O-methyltransferase Ste14